MVTRRNSVLVIGSVSADLTTFSSRLPAAGETFIGDEFTMVLGGKGANQAIAAARASVQPGAQALLVGCYGNDSFAPLVRDGLQNAGVNTAHLTQVHGQTGIAHIRVDASGENNIVVVPGANSQLSSAQIDTALSACANEVAVILTQLEIPANLCIHTAKAAKQHGITMILDPAPATTLPDELWPLIDIVTPNETEAQLLTGIQVTDKESAITAGEWFVQRGVQHALITLAAAGSVLVSATETRFFAPFVVNAVDTTAAGDAFAGHLAAALASGAKLADAVRQANAAGALAVTTKGASPSLPTHAQVQEFLAQHQ